MFYHHWIPVPLGAIGLWNVATYKIYWQPISELKLLDNCWAFLSLKYIKIVFTNSIVDTRLSNF